MAELVRGGAGYFGGQVPGGKKAPGEVGQFVLHPRHERVKTQRICTLGTKCDTSSTTRSKAVSTRPCPDPWLHPHQREDAANPYTSP